MSVLTQIPALHFKRFGFISPKVISLVIMLTAGGCGTGQALEFHVSPTGSDTNAGTAAAPFATPEKARAAVRAAVRDASPAVVWLHGGNYFRTAEFALTSLDNNCIYKAAPNETPRFIGGVKLEPAWFTTVTADSPVWSRLATVARGNVMEVDLAARGITDRWAVAAGVLSDDP
jgi:hypothetical protein